MSKFALLAIFLITCISWLYQPYPIDHNDALYNKYKPSKNKTIPAVSTDSIQRVKTQFDPRATAYNTSKFYDNL